MDQVKKKTKMAMNYKCQTQKAFNLSHNNKAESKKHSEKQGLEIKSSKLKTCSIPQERHSMKFIKKQDWVRLSILMDLERLSKSFQISQYQNKIS
jgi:hypothetical protein